MPELLSALKRVALFSSDRSRAVKLSFAPGELTLTSANPDLGEGRETVPIDFEGDEIFIGLNAHYLVDFLAELGTAEVQLQLKDENTHCLGLPVGQLPGITRYLYIVMPMRI